MKKYSFFILALSLFLFSCGPKKGSQDNLSNDFEKMSRAFISNDFSTYLDFIYPMVITGFGGKEKAVEMFKIYSQQMALEGKHIKTISIGNISKPVKAGKQIHCVVSQNIEMKVPGGTQISESSLLAISEDMGKNWTFFDITMVDKTKIKMLLPDFNDNLKFPERKEGTFIPDKDSSAKQ